MIHTIEGELKSHILDKISDGVIDNDNKDDWHNLCFNQDYYIIGTYKAKQWLREHELDAFEAIGEIVEYEKTSYGEVTTDISEAEKVVNMLVYIYGEEVLNEHTSDTVAELWDWMGGDEEGRPADEEDEEEEEDEY